MWLVRILVIDFYDSFVYNLVHYFRALKFDVDVLRDDEISTKSLSFLSSYCGIVLSPGPGLPEETSSMMRVIRYCDSSIPVFGVCLGMQGIGLHLGGKLNNVPEVRHGIARPLMLCRPCSMFDGVCEPIEVGLYHSWSVEDLPEQYRVAVDTSEVLMALASETRMLYGVQFHPESVMTLQGKKIIENIGLIFLGIFTKHNNKKL